MVAKITLAIAITSASSCGGGAYFSDDGLRIVHDAKTGEYIGELKGEGKVWDKEKGKEIASYKIERKDGSMVELPQSNVKLSKP